MAMRSVSKEGEERCLGEVTGTWTFTVRGLQVVKTNLAIYRMQKAADGWIADIMVFNSLGIEKGVHDKPGSVSRLNGGQQVARLTYTPASCSMHYLYAVAW